MAIGTYEDCCERVRQLLGDTDPPGGDVMTDSEQQVSFESAWDELISMMNSDQVPAAKRIWFHTVPANTTVLPPVQAAILDIDDLVSLDERAAGTSTAITGIVAGTGNQIQVLAVAHGLTGTPEAFISDVLGVPAANGRWFATVLDADNLLLRGSVFSGTYTSGGFVSTSTDKFLPMDRRETLPDRQPDTRLFEFAWREDAIQFVGATQDVQLRITYRSDNSPPQTGGSLIYEGIKNPLAYRTAALLAKKHGHGEQEANDLDSDARGPEHDGHGGHYFLFLQQKVRDLQKDLLQRPVKPPEHLTDTYTIW